jgi:hypothetical protein
MGDLIDAKKEVADEILSLLTPHMSAQLGGNLGYGVNTFGADLIPQATEAIKLWVIKSDPKKLIATLMTANALGVITDSQTDKILAKIKKLDKKEK